MQLWRQLWPEEAQSAWIAGVTLAVTWPLVWAAASGMETLLFAAIGLQTAVLSLQPRQTTRQLGVLGLFSGLLILTRPDGVVLVMLVVVRLVGAIGDWRLAMKHNLQSLISNLIKHLVVFTVAMLLPLLPYFLFNWRASGTVWPNTFYAKQVEYGVLLARPLWARLWELLFYSWGGPQGSPHVLLLPGLIGAGWLALRQDWQEKRLYRLLPLLWAGGHVLLYAWRLPVTYQNGRYLLPILPVWIIYGLAGWRVWLHLLAEKSNSLKLLKLAANLIFALSMLIFLFIGGVQGYANDVALIEGEMVTVAHWLRQNTEPEALIASHDIGAIGYFAERPLLDLAGLISPEVIEMLADESALSDYVLTTEADYLVTAPGWEYVGVATAVDVTSVFTTNYAWTLEQGLNNMTVYKLP
jgi:hypothetical protein